MNDKEINKKIGKFLLYLLFILFPFLAIIYYRDKIAKFYTEEGEDGNREEKDDEDTVINHSQHILIITDDANRTYNTFSNDGLPPM